MVALIERWDPAANVFHLPTGEMTVTLEDVYRILRLPIEGEAVFQVDSETAMDSILQVFGDAAALLTYHSASIGYGDMYRAHRHETRLAVLMMIGVTCFALPGFRGRPLPTGIDGGATGDGGGAHLFCMGTSVSGAIIQGVMGLSPEEAIWYLFYLFVALLGIRAHRMHQAGRATPAARAT
ncbi:hypothetical protein KI387_005673, partial [Taxus chinensis]